MRILQVIDNLQMFGGAQKLQVLFAQTLSGRGHELTVLSLQDDSDSPVTTALEQAGARVVFLPGKNLIDPARFRRMVDFMRREPFDIVHTHLTFSNILGNAAAWLAGKPSVTTLHNERIQKRRYFAIKFRSETYMLRHVAKAVIAVGNSAAEAHRQRLAGKPIIVASNAVENAVHLSAEERRSLRAELVGDAELPLIITIGRLVPQKAYHHLIEAFAQVNRQHPHTRLLIVGDGYLRPALEAQVAELGLQERARLLGLRNDVSRLLAASDIYASSSLWEGLSMAMLEAMAAGLPVVATSVGDAPWVVVDGAGCLTPPEQPQRLAEALASLVADPEKTRRFGSAARQHALRNHSPAVWVEKLLDIYSQAGRSNSLYSREGAR